VSDTWLQIAGGLVQRMRALGAEAYPQECCGALLGRDGETAREVLDLLPLTNRRNDSPRNRFELTPDDVRVAEQTARERHLELIGWYHSHPDAPARPSEFDRQHAWPWYSYIILSVQKGEAQEMTSWRLHGDRGSYDSESIVCQATISAAPSGAIGRERV